ncbi:class I SAM-dependent methyltransferase [Hyphococcus sp.]|uniref:class I SAM-dependent methyltransferase n=1 Tax=Hyphococcus sp. TaxID=2038636 RepID=UPI00208D22B2|nr:MAG: SAM-dependent methyltransferase [Marinicaulis sp.]
MTVNVNPTEVFAGQVVGDVAAALSGVLTNLGHKLGLYKAMAGAGSLTPDALAQKTGLAERYVREWLNNQTAGGYVAYDPASKTYELPDAHVPVLADENSPVFLIPALEVAASLWFDEDKIANAFRTGDGIAWADHHERLFCGTEALFKPGYKTSLIADWIGALDGVSEKLQHGGKVADIGCGHGASAILIAKAFPKAKVHGFDSHLRSVETARKRANEAGSGTNIAFDAATAKNFPGKDYDLVCYMDCLHDMGDPLGAARHAFAALKPGGSVLLVEPAAADSVEDNINPVSRLYYAASTCVCTPCSKSQEVGTALGAQAGPARLSALLKEAGFASVRVAATTPFNIILEARKSS